jgi:hypothetical protein
VLLRLHFTNFPTVFEKKTIKTHFFLHDKMKANTSTMTLMLFQSLFTTLFLLLFFRSSCVWAQSDTSAATSGSSVTSLPNDPVNSGYDDDPLENEVRAVCLSQVTISKPN